MPLIRPGGRTERRLRKFRWPNWLPDTVESHGVHLPLKHPAVTQPIQKDIWFGDYEKPESEIVSKRVESGDRVMEVGAGMGYLSALCARIVGDANVTTYDANPALMDVIAHVHDLNGVKPVVINAMLGDTAGEAEFIVEPDFWASSTHRRSDRGETVKVPQLAIQAELDRIQPNFLIVDIEGGEKGFFQLSNFASVKKLVVEIHPIVIGHDGCSEVFNRLFELGFVMDFSIIRKDVFYFFRPDVS